MRLFRRPAPAPVEWAVVDLETTGLRPTTDRIVEIGLVRLDDQGREIAAWTTLIDPQRDIGASRIHGLTSRDLRGAPTFRDVAGDLLTWLSGAVIVAHNARFDTTFLDAECQRAGVQWGPVVGVCTMTTSVQAGLCVSRSLVGACEELGISLDHHHTALDDARATAALFLRLLPPRFPLPPSSPTWPRPTTPATLRRRTDPPMPRVSTGLGALASRIGAPVDRVDADAAAVLSYLGLLDLVLEDRRLTEDEINALQVLASEWGISRRVAEQLHAHYIHSLWHLALADRIITKAERDDIEIVAELLGVPLELQVSVSQPIAATRAVLPAPALLTEMAGRSVCFTGESVCSIGGVPLDRRTQEELAARAGMIVKAGVSGKLDLLVLADPDSASGKARRARELGIRCVAEPVFWRQVGVPID